MRDDFPIKTKDILARRVGFICSNPECNMLTIGPHTDHNKFTNIGVAAHITAASQQGPRYNSAITSKERQGIANGIWLCQTCSKLIDSDTTKYTVDVLKIWKRANESKASVTLNKQIAPLTSSNKDGVIELDAKGYYEIDFYNQKIRCFLVGEVLHIEQEYPDGTTAYCGLNPDGSLTDEKWPFPKSEYELIIEDDLILTTKNKEVGDGNKIEIIKFKWGKSLEIYRNSDGLVLDYKFKCTYTINHQKKKIWINKPDFQKVGFVNNN